MYFSTEICKCMIGSNYICFIPVSMTVVLKEEISKFLIIICSFPAIGCTQMPRKFRLGRICKNGERKRQKMHRAQGTNKMGRPSKKVGQN